MKHTIVIKNVREKPLKTDGFRVLVDRLWPRGLTKKEVAYDLWAKELAPSTALRKWYGHDLVLWAVFCKRYLAELEKSEFVSGFWEQVQGHSTITLLYGAKDREHNQAVVLRNFLSTHPGGA
jgi:uncharacterized protein YeaO (DUF488 family)